MVDITLNRLANSRGYCTDPDQPIICNDYAGGDVTAGVESSINPLQNDDYLALAPASITAVSALVNCTATFTASSVLITGTSAGAASLTYEATDGNANTDTASITVNVLSGGFSPSWIDQFTTRAEDANGYTVLTPSADSRLMYVSETGDSGTAQFYLPADSEIGADYLNPVGPINAYDSLSDALAQARDGFNDYVLVKRGESFTLSSALEVPHGRSASEPFVIRDYGNATARPYIDSGRHNAIAQTFGTVGNFCVYGLELTCSVRNPNSVNFAGYDLDGGGNSAGVYSISGGPTKSGILIEDCDISYFTRGVSTQTTDGGHDDVTIRRNVIAYCWGDEGTGAHPQGLSATNLSALMEDNFVHHNGWLIKGDGIDEELGRATQYNHNLYYISCNNLIIRNNLTVDPSSIHYKLTANASGTNTIKSTNVAIMDNLMLDGEVGTSMGGNTTFDDGPRWQNQYCIGNVYDGIGSDNPTQRLFTWTFGISDWDTGEVSGNYVVNLGDNGANGWCLSVTGDQLNVTISNNVLIRPNNTQPGVVCSKEADTTTQTSLSFNGNEIQRGTGPVFDVANSPTVDFDLSGSGNTYPASSTFEIDGSSINLTTWQAAYTDTGATETTVTYVDEGRGTLDYLTSISEAATKENLYSLFKANNRLNYDSRLEVDTIREYVKAGWQHA